MPREDITPKLLKELYLKKILSKKEIALLLKCNITTVHKKMRKFSIPTRSIAEAIRIAMQKKIIKIPKSQLENLYLKKKLSIPEIAKILSHDPSIIVRELKKHKIPRRPHSEAVSWGWRKKRIKKSILVKLYYKTRITQEQIAKKLNKSRGHILQLMKGYALKTRRASETQLRYPKSNFSGNLEEKAYLIGFRLGDLNVRLFPSKRIIKAGCTSTKTEQIKLFKDLFKHYGHIWVSKPRKDGNRVFAVYLNRSFDFLLPKQDNIPKWIRENKQYFLSFLAGYKDAEGYIGISNNLARFTLASYDKSILKQIYKQLLQLGVFCNPPRILVKKGYVKSDGYIYRNDEWYFSISKKSFLFSLLNLLRLRLKHQKRLKDLHKATRNLIKRLQPPKGEFSKNLY